MIAAWDANGMPTSDSVFPGQDWPLQLIWFTLIHPGDHRTRKQCGWSQCPAWYLLSHVLTFSPRTRPDWMVWAEMCICQAFGDSDAKAPESGEWGLVCKSCTTALWKRLSVSSFSKKVWFFNSALNPAESLLPSLLYSQVWSFDQVLPSKLLAEVLCETSKKSMKLKRGERFFVPSSYSASRNTDVMAGASASILDHEDKGYSMIGRADQVRSLKSSWGCQRQSRVPGLQMSRLLLYDR